MKATTLFILTRTSHRPVFFRHLRESVKKLRWPGPIVHIVHTDDPRDTYVEGDIIIRGESFQDYPIRRRRGPFNLYNNRLLDAIPYEDGWVHFMDDDDEYASPDVFERLLADADPNKVIVGKVKRGGQRYIPKNWGTQKSFQTEIPVMRVRVARSSRWPATKGGDHIYNRPIVKQYGTQWVEDVLIATSREGKGNGNRRDMKGSEPVPTDLQPTNLVYVKPVLRDLWKPKMVTLQEAEAMSDTIITYKGVVYENYMTAPLPVPYEPRFDHDVSYYRRESVDIKELAERASLLGNGEASDLVRHSRVYLNKLIREGMVNGFIPFRRVGCLHMRPYLVGESLEQIETFGIQPKKGDMIAKEDDCLWLVPQEHFDKWYYPVEEPA